MTQTRSRQEDRIGEGGKEQDRAPSRREPRPVTLCLLPGQGRGRDMTLTLAQAAVGGDGQAPQGGSSSCALSSALPGAT